MLCKVFTIRHKERPVVCGNHASVFVLLMSTCSMIWVVGETRAEKCRWGFAPEISFGGKEQECEPENSCNGSKEGELRGPAQKMGWLDLCQDAMERGSFPQVFFFFWDNMIESLSK